METRTKFIYFVIFAAFILVEFSLRAQNLQNQTGGDELQAEGTFIEVGGNPNNVETENQEQAAENEETKATGVLEKFIDEIPEVKQAYDECIGEAPPVQGDLGTCTWERLGQLNKNAQQRITDSLAEGESETADGKKIAGFERNDLATATQTSDSVTRVFGNLMHKRLRAIMFNDPDGNNATRDHSKFNEIYRSQLGKNLTESLATFCLSVNYNPKFDADPAKNKKADGVNLHFCNDPKTPCPKFSGGKKANKERNQNLLKDPASHQLANENFNNCFKYLPNTCRFSSGESAQEACGVVRLLKNTKQAYFKIDAIAQQWNERTQDAPTDSFNIAIDEKNFDVDKVVNVASGEIDSAELNEADQSRVELAQQCAEDPTQEGCIEFTISTEDKDRMLAEYTIRKEAQFQRLDKELNENGVDAAKMYLAEEGLTQDEIDTLIGDDPDKAIADIRQRYEKEKTNLIASLRNKLYKQAYDPDATDAATKAERIFGANSDAQQSRADEIREAIHYSNIVASFFEVCPGGSSGEDCTKNTGALNNELKNSFYSPDNSSSRDPSSEALYNEEQFAALNEIAEDGDSETTKNLEIDQINKLLYQLGDGQDP